MEPDTLRSCQWSQSSSESSKSLNSPPKITSSLWKQLSEEQDLSKTTFSPFTNSLTDNNLSSEYEINSNFLSSTKYEELWKSPSCDIDTDVGQLGKRSPWDPIATTTQKSSNIHHPGLPSSARHSEIIPSQQGSSNNVWTTNPRAPFGGSSQDTLTGSDSYGFGVNSVSWEPVHSTLRPALKDIGNINLVALMQELSFLTDARGMGNLSYSNSALPTYPSHKPTPATSVPLSSKGYAGLMKSLATCRLQG
ncbi:hypothetical protein E2C01_006373 [Portunus trituberculatus]|uniref:Uncharacterized protein n=1 Tax=Portunus trituberculatus TaxID=210409 RepID=A0A5B7D1N3_PORTR|nr:hypothetical protein [Portunus trituberculatus]